MGFNVKRRKKTGFFVMLSAIALIASGCTNTSSSNADQTAIVHAFGAFDAGKLVSSVATVGWASAEAALALGVRVTTMPRATFGDDNGDGFLPWVYDAVQAADYTPDLHDETDGIPFEKIADSAPERILAINSGITREDYETLSRIAPTLPYLEKPWSTPWRQTISLTGMALNKKDIADQIIAKTEEKIAQERAKHRQLEGKTVMALWVDGNDLGTITYYTPQDTRMNFLNDLGLKTDQSIVDLSEGKESFFATVSAEHAEQLAADIAVIFTTEEAKKAIEANALFQRIPALTAGSVVYMTNDTLTMAVSSPTTLSIEASVGQYLEKLGTAAQFVK